MKVLDENTLFNKSDSLPNINFHLALNEKNFLQNLSYKEVDFLPSLKYSFQNEKNIFMIDNSILSRRRIIISFK